MFMQFIFLMKRFRGSGVYRLFICCLLLVVVVEACTSAKAIGNGAPVNIVDVDSGWAGNSINTTIFRKNSLVSFGDEQFIAFYNGAGNVVLGKRKLGEKTWQLKTT